MLVNLGAADCKLCADRARAIVADNEAARRKDPSCAPPGVALRQHFMGALAECAVAREFALPWPGPVGLAGIKGADCGDVEVKASSYAAEPWLVVASYNDPGAPFVLALVGSCTPLGTHVGLLGWLYGAEAMQPQWLRKAGSRPAFYGVPAWELHDMDSFRERLAAGAFKRKAPAA